MKNRELMEKIRKLGPKQQEALRARMARRNIDISLPKAASSVAPESASPAKPVSLGLFFFSADSHTNDYNLVLDCAGFADEHRFSAVWTPERHFQRFGGNYPNPSLLSAALAIHTRRIRIRAGSLVLPLHNPIRVAEDWAMIDVLSKGRADLSFATGWHPGDFALAPEKYADRRETMFRGIETVRKLWRGESINIRGVEGASAPIRTLPRPIQPELPFWVTATAPPTWSRAGEIGANVLTGAKGSALDELEDWIKTYREARLRNGHNPHTGKVSVMLHTYLDKDDQACREKVREPLKGYLKTFIQLTENEEAAQGADELLEYSFDKYYKEASLMGTPDKCRAMLARLGELGVDEVACLIDFGLDVQDIMNSLEILAGLADEQRMEAVDG